MIRIKRPKDGQKVEIASFRKFSNLQEIEPIIKGKTYKSTTTHIYDKDYAYEISKKEMTDLLKDFFKERDWLRNIYKETFVTDGERVILIDTSGYSYARYVGIIV
jgi:hypothetical protein